MLKRKQYKMTSKRLMLFFVVFGLLLQSCNDFLDIDSKRAAAEDQQWKTLEDTRAALMGIYGLMRAALAENNTHWVCGELRMGDFTVTKRLDIQSVVDNELSKPYNLLSEVSNWRRFYAAINAAAIFIEKAPRTLDFDRSYSQQNLKYDIAQARALRAFAYFYMTRIWGDVPLVTYSYDNGSFPEMPRADASVVLNYAKSELLAAVEDLPYLFGTSANRYYGLVGNEWSGVLFNKLSAYSVLAHISAWEGNYAAAETYAAFVMDNAPRIGAAYTSIADLTSAVGLFSFNSDRKASRILGFNFRHSENEATQSGHLEQWTLATPVVQKAYPEIYVSKDSLFSIFDDPNDLRFGVDTTSNGHYYNRYIYNMNVDFPIFSKIKVVQDGNAKDNDFGVFGSSIVFTRLEEITLLRAEALCALNRSEEAITFLNNTRKQRGLKELSFKKDLDNNKGRLINVVFEERRKELMGEGWRWYDLVRRQKLVKDNEKLLQLVNEGGVYWPVAQEVISTNSRIEQNKFWKH